MRHLALYKQVPLTAPPSASTTTLMEFLLRYGPSPFTTLVKEGFSQPGLDQAVEQRYVVRSGNRYELTELAKAGEAKSVQDLSEEELDFFLGVAAKQDITLVPIATDPMNGCTALLANGKSFSPTVDWKLMAQLNKQFGVQLLPPPPSGPQPWRAEKGGVVQEGPNPTIASARALLAGINGLDADYVCDWRRYED